jgi:Lrp/AsnC family transcriptional regulator, regulator for asnA, asnC and gidA
MNAKVQLDEIDVKILHALIVDARAKLKDIAKDCGVSSAAILNRIKRLKTSGVITGATLFPNITKLGGGIMATLGINLEAGKEEEILKLLQEQINVIDPAIGIGKYDLFALVTAENLNELEKVTQIVRKHTVVTRLTVNIWVPPPRTNFENIDLQPSGVC